jgi:hypothetical protein
MDDGKKCLDRRVTARPQGTVEGFTRDACALRDRRHALRLRPWYPCSLPMVDQLSVDVLVQQAGGQCLVRNAFFRELRSTAPTRNWYSVRWQPIF